MEKNVKTLAKYLFTKGINSSLKIQKILFFLRVEELKSKNTINSFFKEKNNFQAWIYGPVNLESFLEMQKLFSHEEEKDIYILDEETVNEIDQIYGQWLLKYENYAASTLVEMSHKNKAWINARGDLDPDKPCKNYLVEDQTFIEFE